jgi:hypothetical protein
MKNAVIFSIVLVATNAVAWIETISLSSKRLAWPIRPALHFFEWSFNVFCDHVFPKVIFSFSS